MGPLGVVDRQPGVGDLPHLVEGVEEVGVEDFFAIAAVEPFDEGVFDVPISTARASRLPSSSTLKVRNRRPS